MFMKTIRVMIMAALIGFSLQAMSLRAQLRIRITNGEEALKTEPIDKLLFTVEYKAASVADTSHRKQVDTEMMMLKVGAKSSVYYSYSKYIADSVMKAAQAAGLSMEAITEQLKNYQSRIDYKIYKNYPAGKVTTLDELGVSRFKCEETNDLPEWELLADTTTILSYPCRKAVCNFKGREYEAWFTTEIPRSEGPWKLHGLPGLILKAADSHNEYTFECVALVQNNDDESIQYGAAGYEPISRKNINKVYERYHTDPVGYMTSSMPNLQIVVKGQDGQPAQIKNMPYNPIEKAEE
jgi:GLPGLI family protein